MLRTGRNSSEEELPILKPPIIAPMISELAILSPLDNTVFVPDEEIHWKCGKTIIQNGTFLGSIGLRIFGHYLPKHLLIYQGPEGTVGRFIAFESQGKLFKAGETILRIRPEIPKTDEVGIKNWIPVVIPMAGTFYRQARLRSQPSSKSAIKSLLKQPSVF